MRLTSRLGDFSAAASCWSWSGSAETMRMRGWPRTVAKLVERWLGKISIAASQFGGSATGGVPIRETAGAGGSTDRGRTAGRGTPSALHIGKLGGYFSISHGKYVNAAQVPWLTVAHLAVDPEHCGPPSADDHFLGLEPCVGIADEPSAPEFDHGGLSLDASAIGSGRGVLEHGIVGQKRCQPISVVSIEHFVEAVNGCARHLLQ